MGCHGPQCISWVTGGTITSHTSEEHPDLNCWWLVFALLPWDCTCWPSFINECFQRSGPLCAASTWMFLSWFLLCFVLSRKKSLSFQGIGLFYFSANGSVSIFIIGADNHHAVYNSVVTRQLVHMRKYIQGCDHLGLEEAVVKVLFGQLQSGMDRVMWTLFWIPIVAKKGFL